MGYRLLGFAVWQHWKWCLRRRLSGSRRKIVMAGLAALLIGGVVAAQREANARGA